MTDEAFAAVRRRWRAEHDPSKYNRPPCSAFPLATVPATGNQLRSWALIITNGYRRMYAAHFFGAVRTEAITRGYGSWFPKFSRSQVYELYTWARAELTKIDEAERVKQAERGPYKPKAIERAR